MMNITRTALSIALLFSVASIAADTEAAASTCEQSSVSTEVFSVEDMVKQAIQDFNLTEDEAAQLAARLESAEENADIAAIIAEIRAQNEAEVKAVATELE